MLAWWIALTILIAPVSYGADAVPGGAGPAVEGATPSATEILASAFANRYEVDLVSKIELVMRNRTGQERRRKFRAVSKVIDDRVHSIGRLVAPDYLRGFTIMTIENSDRSHDAFVYLPSLEKVRRVTTAQRGDSFFGSDVTYEDLERRRVGEYALDGVESGQAGGELVYVIRGRSLRNFSYARVEFVVAVADKAILETRFFKRDQDEPFRVVSAPRAAMVERDGHVIPTRLTVENRIRGTSTDVLISDLEINPEIDDHLFSVGTLEHGRRLHDSSP